MKTALEIVQGQADREKVRVIHIMKKCLWGLLLVNFTCEDNYMRISVNLFGTSNTCSFLFINSFVRGYEQHSQKNRPVIYFATDIDNICPRTFYISICDCCGESIWLPFLQQVS
jgi:hypothetical protein